MTIERGYQLHLSHGDSVLKDAGGRTQKFEKILRIVQDFRPETRSLSCLDIGCSSGIITFLLGEHFQRAIGIDIDEEALQYAQSNSASANVFFLKADSMSLPLPSRSMDVVICNHIYEHVPKVERMIGEIFRVLKDDGFCYFSAGNRLMIIEGHYGLPFLSWVPEPIAHRYLKLTKKGTYYYERHFSLWGLRRLLKNFVIHDYTLSVIRDPEKYSVKDLINPSSFKYRWLRWMAPYFYPWIPTYIWILTKKKG
jgi:ubiquinone/menaquinone biosynthesis C-methylase UbiE